METHALHHWNPLAVAFLLLRSNIMEKLFSFFSSPRYVTPDPEAKHNWGICALRKTCPKPSWYMVWSLFTHRAHKPWRWDLYRPGLGLLAEKIRLFLQRQRGRRMRRSRWTVPRSVSDFLGSWLRRGHCRDRLHKSQANRYFTMVEMPGNRLPGLYKTKGWAGEQQAQQSIAASYRGRLYVEESSLRKFLCKEESESESKTFPPHQNKHKASP